MRWSDTRGSLAALTSTRQPVPRKNTYRPRKTISEDEGPNVFVCVRTKGSLGTGYWVLSTGYWVLTNDYQLLTSASPPASWLPRPEDLPETRCFWLSAGYRASR